MIGALLVESGRLRPDDLERGLALQKQPQHTQSRIGQILIRLGAVSEDVLLEALSAQLGLPIAEGDRLPVDPAPLREAILASGVPASWFGDAGVALWEDADGRFVAACRDPLEPDVREVLGASAVGGRLAWHLVRTKDLARLLQLQAKSPIASVFTGTRQLRELAEAAPVIELVNNVMAQAIDERASDIHVEPDRATFNVRFRVDGILHTKLTLPREQFDAVASRIKLIGAMDIAERRLPQDGRVSIRASGTDLDLRISSVPGVHGESLVLRLLPKAQEKLSIERLGLEPDHLALLRTWLAEPHGILLVTGPTGSGKSTTLYASLIELDDRQHKIITVEDPVELRIEGITQIQAHAEIGYTFSRALRAILRQDPDIIMIGEIRDVETAEIAIQAAMTGHMVLSTVHTNDALSAFVRLIDMGVEPFLIASTVRAVQAQRLVRRVCEACCTERSLVGLEAAFEAARARFPDAFGEPARLREAKGCPQCRGTGYRGRVGIYEMAPMSPGLHDAILRRSTGEELARIGRAAGMRTLFEDGLIKAWRGVTTLEEVYRALRAEGAV